MLALKQFRSQIKGFPDLLNYAAEIENGIILGKDGSLTAGWIYRGNDLSSSLPVQLNVLASQINSALAMFGTGWMTHHDCIRTPVSAYGKESDSHFPDPISKLIDQERRERFETHGNYFESIHVVMVTYLPPTAGKSKISEYVYEEDGKRTKGSATVELKRFIATISEFEERLSSYFKMTRLQGHPVENERGERVIRDELLSYFHWVSTGLRQPINLPSVPMYLDALIGAQDLRGGIAPQVGQKKIRIIGIDGFPQESYPAILDRLDQVPIAYRWNTRFIYLEGYEAEGELERFRKVWEQKERSLRDQVFNTKNGKVDLDAQAMNADATNAKAEAASGIVRYGYYTANIVLMDEDDEVLDESTKMIVQILRNLGFATRLETINAMEAWLGTLPSHGVQNIRRPPMHTMNLAHLLPLSSVWAGSEFNPCPFFPAKSPPLLYGATDGSTPWRFNNHVGDVGHVLMLGPTGAGKSTKLTTMMAQFLRYQNASVFGFDNDYSAFALTKAANGAHYDLAGDGEAISFAPLAGLKTDKDIGWASEWIELLVTLQGVELNPNYRKEIHKALMLHKESQHQSLTDFQTTIQIKELSDALQPYTTEGPFGTMFDADEDSLEDSNFQMFEIGNLIKLGERAVLPALDYLFHRIEKQLKGQPALIPLDEGWVMLGHPAFREKLKEWLKVLRKANASIVLATQSLTDAANSGILDVLNEACLTKIYLANPGALEDEMGHLYRRLGMNQTQIEIISGMTGKRDYYYSSPLGNRRYRLDLGPIALAFVGVSGKEEVTNVRNCIEKHGQGWQIEWLKQRGGVR